MTVVVDTSVLLDHLRGDTRAQTVLAGVTERGEALVGSVLTKVEKHFPMFSDLTAPY